MHSPTDDGTFEYSKDECLEKGTFSISVSEVGCVLTICLPLFFGDIPASNAMIFLLTSFGLDGPWSDCSTLLQSCVLSGVVSVLDLLISESVEQEINQITEPYLNLPYSDPTVTETDTYSDTDNMQNVHTVPIAILRPIICGNVY